jgi:predicted 3-demethylubiquinone-9 3-methyltransferase (glyoxalase superfamily)
MALQKIVPNLWYDTQAEEASNLYVSLFENSKVGTIMHYDQASAEAAGMEEGDVLTVEFELEGQSFVAINGGPQFKFTEAVSFMVSCQDQAEVDHFWDGLIADGGEASQCGWLKDKFGLSWQITPIILTQLLSDPDPEKAGNVMKAMLGMKKIVIADLQKAYAEAGIEQPTKSEEETAEDTETSEAS